MTQITVRPTQGFTTPPKGMEFTATIRETKRGGISGKSNYGATAEIAKANLMARLESEGHQFEDADGNPVTQYVQPDGMLSDKRYGDENCCNECFVTSHDVLRGDFSMVAVPEGCGDEECECHQLVNCRCDHATDKHKMVRHADNQFPNEECTMYGCICGKYEPAKCFTAHCDKNFGHIDPHTLEDDPLTDKERAEVGQMLNAEFYRRDLPEAMCDTCGDTDTCTNLDGNRICYKCFEKDCEQLVVADRFLQDEYGPNFNGFISTVTPKEIATISLVVLMIATIWIATT